MKTLAYKVIFRLYNQEIDERSYNNGFIIAYFNESNKFIKLEGILTSDYLIAQTVKDELVFTIYTSYILRNIYSANDIYSLYEKPINILEIYWEDSVDMDELEFPFDFEFEHRYGANGENVDWNNKNGIGIKEMLQIYDNSEHSYFIERAQLVVTEPIEKEEYEKYMLQLERFKRYNVLLNEGWT